MGVQLWQTLDTRGVTLHCLNSLWTTIWYQLGPSWAHLWELRCWTYQFIVEYLVDLILDLLIVFIGISFKDMSVDWSVDLTMDLIVCFFRRYVSSKSHRSKSQTNPQKRQHGKIHISIQWQIHQQIHRENARKHWEWHHISSSTKDPLTPTCTSITHIQEELSQQPGPWDSTWRSFGKDPRVVSLA